MNALTHKHISTQSQANEGKTTTPVWCHSLPTNLPHTIKHTPSYTIPFIFPPQNTLLRRNQIEMPRNTHVSATRITFSYNVPCTNLSRISANSESRVGLWVSGELLDLVFTQARGWGNSSAKEPTGRSQDNYLSELEAVEGGRVGESELFKPFWQFLWSYSWCSFIY